MLCYPAPTPTELYPLSLHDALPISARSSRDTARRSPGPRPLPAMGSRGAAGRSARGSQRRDRPSGDRKSTRLNSSHTVTSYAVFCLKKKNAEMLINTPIYLNNLLEG